MTLCNEDRTCLYNSSCLLFLMWCFTVTKFYGPLHNKYHYASDCSTLILFLLPLCPRANVAILFVYVQRLFVFLLNHGATKTFLLQFQCWPLSTLFKSCCDLAITTSPFSFFVVSSMIFRCLYPSSPFIYLSLFTHFYINLFTRLSGVQSSWGSCSVSTHRQPCYTVAFVTTCPSILPFWSTASLLFHDKFS